MYDFPITNLCVISFFVLVNSFGGKREMLMRKSWLFSLYLFQLRLFDRFVHYGSKLSKSDENENLGQTIIEPF